MRTSLALLLLLSACSSAPSEEAPPPHTGQDSSAGDEDTTSPPEAAPEAEELPPTVAPGQGEQAFGVYLAEVGDPAQATAWMDRLRERGVENAGSGELNCDRGAAEALSLAEDTVVVSIAFATEEEANRFVALWGEPVLGVAAFTAYCRD